MKKQVQLLVAVLLCFLFSVDCHAQNDHDAALLKKIAPASSGFRTHRPTNTDENGNITSVSFGGIKGEFDSFLKLEHLESIQLLQMNSGWLEQIAKKYPDLSVLDFDARLLKANELKVLGEFKNLTRLAITGANSDGAECLGKIGEFTKLRSLVIPLKWQQNLHQLKGLPKLRSLRSGTRGWSLNSGETFITPQYKTLNLLYRFLVDEQKRSLTEASEVLGLFSNGHFELPALYDELVPYFNKLENIDEMTLGVGELSKEGLGSLKLPSGLKKLCLSNNRSLQLLDTI